MSRYYFDKQVFLGGLEGLKKKRCLGSVLFFSG